VSNNLTWFFFEIGFISKYLLHLIIEILGVKKLFCELWFVVLAYSGLQMCCLVGGQNKFPRTSRPIKRAPIQSICFCNYFNLFYILSMCRVSVFYTCIQAHSFWMRESACGGRADKSSAPAEPRTACWTSSANVPEWLREWVVADFGALSYQVTKLDKK